MVTKQQFLQLELNRRVADNRLQAARSSIYWTASSYGILGLGTAWLFRRYLRLSTKKSAYTFGFIVGVGTLFSGISSIRVAGKAKIDLIRAENKLKNSEVADL